MKAHGNRRRADDVEPQSLLAGIVPRRGTMALSAADTLVNKDGKLELDSLRRPQPVQLSEEWGDNRTATQKTPAEQQRSSLTGIDRTGTAECRRGWRFRSPAASYVCTYV